MRKEGEIYADPAPPPSAVTLRGSLDGSASGRRRGLGRLRRVVRPARSDSRGGTRTRHKAAASSKGGARSRKREGAACRSARNRNRRLTMSALLAGSEEMRWTTATLAATAAGTTATDWGERTPAAFNYHHHASGTLVGRVQRSDDGRRQGLLRAEAEVHRPAGSRPGRRTSASGRSFRDGSRSSPPGRGTTWSISTGDRFAGRRGGERCKPLEYWRGETKHYTRTHASLPTVEEVTTRTPNPYWPMKTPAENHRAGGGKRGRMDSAKGT